MRDLLLNLKERNYQNKKVAIIENGTWAPNAARCMKEIISTMKNIEIVEPVVTIKSTLKEEDIEKLNELAKNLLSSGENLKNDKSNVCMFGQYMSFSYGRICF